MQWLLANLFLLGIVVIGAGSFFLVGFTMWKLNLPPDDHPGILTIGCVLSLVATFFVCKRIYTYLSTRV